MASLLKRRAEREKSVNFNLIGDRWLLLGNTQKALAAYQKGLEIRLALAKDRGNAEAQRDLSVSYERLGDVLGAQGDLAGARDAYQKGQEIYESLVRDHPGSLEFASTRSVISICDELHLRHAASLARLGDHAKATAEASTISAPDSSSASLLYDSACVYSIASAAARKDRHLPQAARESLAERFADRALELLTRACEDEHFLTPAEVEHMKKDPDLDPLRQRDDFKKLMVKLEEEACHGDKALATSGDGK